MTELRAAATGRHSTENRLKVKQVEKTGTNTTVALGPANLELRPC